MACLKMMKILDNKSICEVCIMKYKTDNLGVDDIDLSDEPVPEG